MVEYTGISTQALTKMGAGVMNESLSRTLPRKKNQERQLNIALKSKQFKHSMSEINITYIIIN